MKHRTDNTRFDAIPTAPRDINKCLIKLAIGIEKYYLLFIFHCWLLQKILKLFYATGMCEDWC